MGPFDPVDVEVLRKYRIQSIRGLLEGRPNLILDMSMCSDMDSLRRLEPEWFLDSTLLRVFPM